MNTSLSPPGPRLLVFDWDGTLIDSIEAIVACSNAMFAELGVERLPRERVLSLIGMGLSESIDALVPGTSPKSKERVIETYRRLWFDDYHQRPLLIEGVEALLEDLAGAGYLLAVATAKGRRGLAADLKRLGLEARFDSSRTADESASKPSPVMLLEILEELGVRADEALMIGDSIHDIQMGHNAGVRAVAVESGAQTREALLAADPVECLASVRDLPGWLGRG